MTRRLKFRTGDYVVLLAGDDKGAKGKIKSVLDSGRRVLVEGVNLCVRHNKPSQSSPGGIDRVEAPVDISNIAHLDPEDGRPTRIRYALGEQKARVAVRSGRSIDAQANR